MGTEEVFWSTHSKDEAWDYLVIGSGMGGMTCAALLSSLGFKVLILEQHYVPGGFTQTFRRKRWVWDVGVHAVGEVTEEAMLGRILREITLGKLEWVSLGDVYDDFNFPDARIRFPSTPAAFREELLTHFPDESQAISRYFNLTKTVAGSMKNYYGARMLPPQFAALGEKFLARDAHRFLTQTTAQALRTITSNERLANVLTAQWGYYGSPPERSSFAVHALTARHFAHGAYYPVGGSQAIAQWMCRAVAAAGGWTRIKADVEQIVIEDGVAVGVRLKGGEVIRAKNGVISAAGALPTAERLLSQKERDMEWVKSIAALPPSPCHICLYLGFKGDIRKARATPANIWFYETWSHQDASWDVGNPEVEAKILYCSFPSLKDPTYDPGPEELHTGEVVTFMPYEAVQRFRESRWRRRADDYEALKKEWTERLLGQFLRHMPELKPYIEWVELSTPLSTEFFTRAPAGAIYGLEPTPARYQNPYLRPRTPIKNLFLAGADMASVGVMGAMVGGVLAATSAEPVRALPWLKRVVGGKLGR